MTLEDFFTLSEMKDGLASLNRVEELLAMMQNQKDCVGNVVGDAARQWATVASILAITEDKDCLNHFMQLDGLLFMNHWLQEAQSWSDNNRDCSVEELIGALLRALDRLPVDKEKSSASGIGSNVKQLHGYRSRSIQEKARTLYDKWNHTEDGDSNHLTVDENGPSCNDELKLSTEMIRTEEGVQSGDPILQVAPSDDVSHENAKSCPNSSLVNSAKEMKISSHSILNSSDRNVVSGEMNTVDSSLVSNPCREILSTEEELACLAAGVASTGTCSSPESKGRNVDELSNVSNRKDASDGPEDMDIEVNMKGVSPCRNSQKEICSISAETSLHKKEDIETTSDSKEAESDPNLKVDKGVESKISSALKSPVLANTVGEIDRRRSDIGLEYGEIDALEVARQVAIEVEREVVDYREPFCSSSPEVISHGETMDSCSSDLAENKNEKPVGKQLSGNGMPRRKGLSDVSSPRNSTRTPDVDNKDPAHGLESPRSTSVQESVGNTDKNKCDFDLNEVMCPEEADCEMILGANQSINLSAPIHVAASKGAPSWPVAPLHFEGELGWRGSAATSAFRPASPRKTSDSEKTASSKKQKGYFLEIDLNVAEREDDAADNLLDGHTPLSSSIPSDKSSMETGSRGAERLKLDLNRIGDEDMLLNQPSCWRPYHQNGNSSSSPASSSSSRQHSMRDFDLNDNPLSFDACGSNSLDKSASKETTYGFYRLDDPVITIMGSRMSVERKEFVNQPQRSFLGNGLGVDSPIRALAPYPPMPPHGYGYHGLPMGPTLPMPPAFYGPGSIPYMVDSRGAAVIPQLFGSAGLAGATPARPPFLMNVAGPPSGGLNMVAGVSRPGLDLNSGTTPAEAGNREMGGAFKQLFMQGNSGITEDHMTSASQPASGNTLLKRKEPDCGWEPFTLGYKQATSWQ